MVALFYRIGMVAAVRPGKLATIELLVQRLSRPTDATLDLLKAERPPARVLRFKE